MIGFTTFSFAQKTTTDLDLSAPFNFGFNNKTSKTIYVAVRYQNNNDVWVTKSWFKYRPYQGDREDNSFTIETYNRYIYYYARTEPDYNGNWKYWGGDDNWQYVDGVQYGFKEVYIDRTKYPEAKGQLITVGLTLK
jgi:uncharacterized membrane protein